MYLNEEDPQSTKSHWCLKPIKVYKRVIMGKYSKRFNEKARSGMMAKREKLRRARQKQFNRESDNGSIEAVKELEKELDPNSEVLQPMTQEEREHRKRKLEELVLPKTDTKISRAKKKRLEKYIEHQLKREEKQVLIDKLKKSKFDTTLLKSSKLLGRGKLTKNEEFEEALNLERQGRGDEETNEILYEKRVILDWDSNHGKEKPEQNIKYGESFEEASISSVDEDSKNKSGTLTDTNKLNSSFVDLRPTKFGGSGSGFAFQNLPKVRKVKKSYNWKQILEAEHKRKHKIEDDQDFISDNEENEHNFQDVSGPKNALSDMADDSLSDSDNSKTETSEYCGNNDEEDQERSKFTLSSKAESFKDWADQQMKKLQGRDGEILPTLLPQRDHQLVDRPEDREDGLKDDFIPIDENSTRKVFYITVNRSDELQKARMQLPVFGEEHRIMEAIHHHDVVIISGETGSGKTTQVPQFLYEAGYGSTRSPDTPGMIGITQPRRVAAVSMAERVSRELGDHGGKVGYQIRFDSTTNPDTRIKFMTDGVLLREMMTDFLLEKYSAIVVDEAHERNINTDILIGMLSRVVRLRHQINAKNPNQYKKLKLIIMSATLRVSDFSQNSVLFAKPPPILKVEARQFPVSIHFNKHTTFDYIDEAFRKTCKIHQKLPPGGILVFLTGQNEICTLVNRLKKQFPFTTKTKDSSEAADPLHFRVNSKQADFEAEEIDLSVKVDGGNMDDYDEEGEDEETEEGFEEVLETGQTDQDPLYVLPLYSLLPTKDQMKVFENPPKGSRLCIIATNVAETSLTIPGIRYVVDAGRVKERKYDEKTRVQSFEVDWISKASADQRAGRAGRTGPGHCYRLYSSSIYQSAFPQFSKPEILRIPIESVVLSMKSMGIDNVINFPFPTPPAKASLRKAETLLEYLGALTKEHNITELGKNMSFFPLSPRFAKMLIVGNQQGCLPYVVAIVSVLSVGDPFIGENELGIGKPTDNSEEQEYMSPKDIERTRKLRSKYNSTRLMFSKIDKYSDALKLLSAVCAYDHVPDTKRGKFMTDHFLRGKTLEETIKLRKQVMYIVKSITTKENVSSTVTDGDMKLGVPSDTQVKLIKQMISAGFVDQVAVRADLVDPDVKLTNNTNIINIPYLTLLPIGESHSDSDTFVYIHPTSVICSSGEVPPKYLVYESVRIGSNNNPNSTASPKIRMRALTDISAMALTNIEKTSGLLTYSKPLGPPYAPKIINHTKRVCYVVPRIGAAIGSGSVGWDLPPIKVTQNRLAGQWITE